MRDAKHINELFRKNGIDAFAFSGPRVMVIIAAPRGVKKWVV